MLPKKKKKKAETSQRFSLSSPFSFKKKKMNTTMPIKWLPFPASVTSQCDVTELIGNDEFWLGDTWAKQRYLPWQFFYVDYDVLKKCGADGMVLKLQDEWIKVSLLRLSEITFMYLSL